MPAFAKILAGVAVAAFIGYLWWWGREQDNPTAHADMVRDEVRAAGEVIDACLERLSDQQGLFDARVAETERIQGRIRDLESIVPEGVPADSYDIYLAEVSNYNASLRNWRAQGDTLEAVDAACRDVIEARNVLADSLRRLLIDMQYLPDPSDLIDLGIPLAPDSVDGSAGSVPPSEADR